MRVKNDLPEVWLVLIPNEAAYGPPRFMKGTGFVLSGLHPAMVGAQESVCLRTASAPFVRMSSAPIDVLSPNTSAAIR